MQFTEKQQKAITEVKNWLEGSDQQVFKLFGYAGTGKTTLAKELVADISGQVLFAAYTGKAAHVLSSKGCPATTIHKLIYNPSGKSQKNLKEYQLQLTQTQDPKLRSELQQKIRAEEDNLKKPRFTLNLESALRNCKLAVIDECSMIDEKIGEDLLSFGTKILVLGDPAQLPPPYGTGFFTKGDPDFTLTEIHRQAEENPIIQIATKIRKHQSLSLGLYGESKIITNEDREQFRNEILAADQVIVGKNATRYNFNKRIRELKNFNDPLPQKNDKLICLNNNHELGLLNGAIFYVVERYDVEDNKIFLEVQPENSETVIQVVAHVQPFLGQEIPWYEKADAEQFDFGYAVTCHKSQGSQWDSVLVYDESYCFKKDSYKWLYTAVTRAAEKLTIVRT